MERWLVTGPWPAMTRWWNAQGGRTQLAVAVAGVFVLASMLNLATTSFGKATTNRAPIAVGASAAVSIPSLLAETAPADAGKSWSVTKVWQGTGSKETEEFEVGDTGVF